MNSSTVIMKVGKVLDGTGSEPFTPGAIVVRGDTIMAVGSEQQIGRIHEADARVLEFSGAAAMPGLIDAHVHLVLPGDGTPVELWMQNSDGVLLMQAASNARRALFSGVTTVADMGARNSVVFTLRQAIQRGLAVGPRLIVAGRPLTRTRGHCWFFNGEADGTDAIRRMVRQLIGEGADIIKVMATGGGTKGSDPSRPAYQLEELQRAVNEAHLASRKTVAHCTATEGIRRALVADFDVIVHAHFRQADGGLVFQPDVASQLAEAAVFVNPTLQVNLSRTVKLRSRGNDLTAEERSLLDVTQRKLENVARLVDYGVKMVAGSDAGWAVNPFGDFISELEAMVEIGMRRSDVLLAATRDAALALGCHDLLGTLEVGKKADILVIDGDPRHSFDALRSIRMIMLGGEVIYTR
jgi:imidazolonepropionase-like amidohydrolase